MQEKSEFFKATILNLPSCTILESNYYCTSCIDKDYKQSLFMPYPCVSKKNDVSVMARLWLGYGSVKAFIHLFIFAFLHLVIVKIKKRKRKSALKEK